MYMRSKELEMLNLREIQIGGSMVKVYPSSQMGVAPFQSNMLVGPMGRIPTPTMQSKIDAFLTKHQEPSNLRIHSILTRFPSNDQEIINALTLPQKPTETSTEAEVNELFFLYESMFESYVEAIKKGTVEFLEIVYRSTLNNGPLPSG